LAGDTEVSVVDTEALAVDTGVGDIANY
jgi:hypothetical protein